MTSRSNGGSHRLVTAAEEKGAARWPLTADTGAASFDGFYGAAARRLVRYAYVLTGSTSDARDIAQAAGLGW